MKKPSLSRNKIFVIAFIMLLALMAGAVVGGSSADDSEVTYSQLRKDIQDGLVEKVTVQPFTSQAEVEYSDKDNVFYVDIPTTYSGEELTKLTGTHGVELVGDASAGASRGLRRLAEIMLPVVILVALILFLFRRMIPTGKTKSSTELQEKVQQRFSDVAGADEVIEELQDVRMFLSDPSRFERLGAKVPKGVLLYGPPGTGKTLLARALAGEAEVPFFAVSGSDFVEMYAGLGASRIRDLFKKAREKSPAIVFVDELDAIGRARSGGGSTDGGTREADQTLNALLTEMDGFEVGETPVILIAATNRLEVLDPALVRPGRFDRRIPVDPPDRVGREQILKTHAEGKSFSEDVDLHELARRTSGMTGAELANVLNEAALVAARREMDIITTDEIEEAVLRVLAGPARQHRQMSDHERNVIAYHEAGHALVGEKVGQQIDKISIIPRGRSGGQTLTSSDDKMLLDLKDLKGRLAMLLAGRAAEKVVFGEATSGARDDLVRANQIAESAINDLGFAENSPLRVRGETGGDLGEELVHSRDKEVENLLQDQEKWAEDLLTEDREILDVVVTELLDKETLTRAEFLALIGKNAEEVKSVPPEAEKLAAPVESDGDIRSV